MAGRADRKMVVVDVAVPRDVDADVSAVPGVVLHTIDDIQSVVDHRSRDARRRSASRVEHVIADEAARFDAWGRARVARAQACPPRCRRPGMPVADRGMRVGTRASRLALWQTEHVVERPRRAAPGWWSSA